MTKQVNDIDLQEAVVVAVRILDSYKDQAADINMPFNTYMEKVKWPNDYRLAYAVLKLVNK